MRRRILVVDVVAVHDHAVTRMPVPDGGAGRGTTTPAASEPTTWYGRSWRAPHLDSLPSRARKPKVGSGSKIDVHTVLKLMALAITAT